MYNLVMKEIVIKTSEIIKSALNILGISADAFAFSIGKDRATVYRYMSGETNVPVDVLTKLLDLAYYHGVDITKILNIAFLFYIINLI